MAEKKGSVKYKFGQRELDMDQYLKNIGNNVQSYLQDRRKRGWTDDQVQEFSTTYNRYMDAFKQQLSENSNRFSTDDLGSIIDTQGEFTNIDNDDEVGGQFYYNDKGEKITNDDYNMLKDKKKKGYKTFNANRQVAEYFRTIGNAMQTKAAEQTEKFDINKHGFVSWWKQKYNPAGGQVDLKPFLDKDPVGPDGKRPVNVRAKMASEWMNEYLNWLGDKNLDYSNYDQFPDYETYSAKGRELATKWGDGKWDSDDLIAGQAFGVGGNWANGFFTELENPDLTPAQQQAQDDEKKQKDILKAKQKWIADQQAIFTGSNPAFTYENPFTQIGMDSNHWYNADGTLNTENYYSAWGNEFLNPDKSINPAKLQTYIDQYVQNPFATQYAGKHARNIVGLINSGIAQQIPSGDYQGMYYIPSKSDEDKNRALIYDPNTKKMFYDFIGHVPQVWSKMVNKYKVDNGLVNPSDQFMFKEGGVVSMQTGGDFGNAFVQSRNKAVETTAANAGTTARKFLNDRRKIAGNANTFDNNNGGLTEADYYHIAGLVGDVGSIIGSFSGAATMGTGSLVGAGVGAAGTTSHLIGDIKEDGFQWSDVGRAAVGYGLDLLGIVPGAGITKLGKVGNGILKIAPKLATIVAGSAAVMNAGPILASLKKATTDTSNMTVDDWRNVSQALMLALGGARAAAGKRTFNKVRPKTGEVAIDLKNKRTGEIETRKFSGDAAKKLQEAKSNKDVIAILQKESPALGEYELATSTSWIPKPQWVRKNGWIGDGWQSPVRFDSRRVRPMVVRTDKRAGNIEYATPQSPLKNARTKLVTQTKEEINEGIVKTQMDKLKAASDRYEKALETQSRKLNAAKVRKAEIDKAIADKKYTSRDAYETIKGRGERLKGKGHDRLIDRIVVRKYGMTEEGASKQQKYYEGLIKKLEELKSDGHTKAYQDFVGKKNAEGIVEFTTPGGETIQRDFAELIRRYAIKHEEGGKFTSVRKYQLGNPIRNVQGNADWFRDMYKHKSMTNWLGTWNVDNYENFNKLQDSWINNLGQSGYDPNNPAQAKYGQGVAARQAEWNKTGTNAAIKDLTTLGVLKGNGGTGDKAETYQDGYFGAQEYLRHGGTNDSWFGHEEELAAQKELFKKQGLDYYADPMTGMYKLRPLQQAQSESTVPQQSATQSLTRAATQVDPEGESGSGSGDDGSKTQQTRSNAFDGIRNLLGNPDFMSIGRTAYANKVNDIMTERSIKAARESLTLYDQKDDTKYLKGDLDAMMAGQQAAGQMYHIASQPMTSDASLQLASYLDAAGKAETYITQGRAANNQALRKSAEELWQLRKANADFNYDVAMRNRASIGDLIDNIANLENARDAKRYANNDTLLQELQYKQKQKANRREALEEKFALSDIHNNVFSDPASYGVTLNDAEQAIWQKVQSGAVQPSNLKPDEYKTFMQAYRKVSEAEQNEMRKYYGISTNRFSNVRNLSTETSRYTPMISVNKDGAKIAVAKIRERTKDADRFQKTIKDKHDRVDKAIARADKKMYPRRDPERRRRK